MSYTCAACKEYVAGVDTGDPQLCGNCAAGGHPTHDRDNSPGSLDGSRVTHAEAREIADGLPTAWTRRGGWCEHLARYIAQAEATEAELATVHTERDRLQKLFDDAGEGQYNVLALVDHYQREAMDAGDELRALRARNALLEDVADKARTPAEARGYDIDELRAALRALDAGKEA